MPKNKVPKGKQVTQARLACSIRSQKTEARRTQMTAGGNMMKCSGTTSTSSAGLAATKTTRTQRSQPTMQNIAL